MVARRKVTHAEEVFPRPFTSKVRVHMDRIAGALLEFKRATGALPQGGNAEMVKALRKADPRLLTKKELNSRGEVVDPWGRPYVYLVPGRENPTLFDLYSLGPTGKGKADPKMRVYAELFRI
jgi:hypothetical protein